MGLSIVTAVGCSSSSSGNKGSEELVIEGYWKAECFAPTSMSAASYADFYSFKADGTFEQRNASYSTNDCSGEPDSVGHVLDGTYEFTAEEFTEVSGAYKLNLTYEDPGFMATTKYTAIKPVDGGVLVAEGDATYDGETEEKRKRDFGDDAEFLQSSDVLPELTPPQ